MKKKLHILFLLLVTLIPYNVLAYSNYIIPGGKNIGIKLENKYVSIVGFYKVNNKYIGEDAGFKVGDLISKIENEKVNSIDDMIKLVDKYKDKKTIKITVIRNSSETDIDLTIEKDDSDVYKTGLYVKDQINGIGTLTYIDPETMIYGALGHEIADKNTLERVEINSGDIYSSVVTDIKPSKNGEPGEKKAKIDIDNKIGTINENTESGIYGEYTSDIESDYVLEVGTSDDINLGNAFIRTVIDKDIIKEYAINIIEIDKKNDTKNILFEITDKELLERTGGVVAGMSGSPIIQNNKIIGAVTHVIVNDSSKGYGIFITTMLEEGES